MWPLTISVIHSLPHFMGRTLKAASEEILLYYNHWRIKLILFWENYLGMESSVAIKFTNTDVNI